MTAKDNPSVKLKYVLALLNSKLYFVWLYHRGKRKGETLELYKEPLSEIPIKLASTEIQQAFIDVVDEIMSITTASNYEPNHRNIRQVELEDKVDEMVYKLYELSNEERSLILSFFP